MEEAIKNNEKIKITFNPSKNSKKVVHPAYCNRCDEKIYGLRWKCFECKDFDFCNSCYVLANGKESFKNHEASHCFGLIENPITMDSFNTEKEKYLNQLQIQKDKESIERERLNLIRERERLEREKLEKESLELDNLERERIEKENQEKNKLENEKKVIYPFEQKLTDLEEMGFTDRKNNIRLLIKHKGDMNAVFAELLPKVF